MNTKKSRRASIIKFLPVEQRPCERLPGGTVVGKVVTPALEEPFGWIVSCPVEQPSDEPSQTSIRTIWHFLPDCMIEPVLSNDSDLGALYNNVRRQYHGIYNRLPFKHRRKIVKGDDCDIESMVLKYCELSDFWDDNELCNDYSVIHNVLPDCNSADYWSREWEGGGAGLSGNWYYVETQNPALFIREVRKLIEALLAEKLAKPPPPPKRPRTPKAKKTAPKTDPPAPTDH